MEFWDGPGTWQINASIEDNNNYYESSSETFSVGATSGFIIENTSISWTELNPGATNEEANSPIKLQNTGNTIKNIKINSTNLVGETDNSKKIFANDFSIGPTLGCNGTLMENYSEILIQNSQLPKGNYILGTGQGEEELFFCITEIPQDLTQQNYTTSREGAWIIKIFTVVLSTARRKKLKKEIKKLETKGFSKDEIIEILSEEKETIPIEIFKKELGALESITKYMKENMNLTYVKISEIINRNQKTIWTAYKKSNEKFSIKFKDETEHPIPIEIFKSTNLTILETIISYLRNKNMKFSEIGQVLNRDQRNIWTINNRIKNKQ